MGVSQLAKDAKAKYKKYKTAKGYYETVKAILDEDTRSGELFKQGIKGLTKIGEKLVGKGFSKHPYFAYHKTHLEALGSALTASDTHNNAMKALEKAIASADSTEALAAQLKLLTDRKQALKLFYAMKIQNTQQFLRNARTDPAQAEDDLEGSGETIESVAAKGEVTLEDWRAEACLLYSDSVDLLAMVDIEYRAAAAAYGRFTDKVKKLQASKKSIDRVAGLAAEKKRQEEWAMRELDQVFRPGSGPAPEAVSDPSLHAKRQRDKVETVVGVLGKICDSAMSSDPRYPNKLTAAIGSL